jgi:hypothetical protein
MTLSLHQDVEHAAGRQSDAACFRRMRDAFARLARMQPCDTCHAAPATVANGDGDAWCARCAAGAVVERRASLERSAAAKADLEALSSFRSTR